MKYLQHIDYFPVSDLLLNPSWVLRFCATFHELVPYPHTDGTPANSRGGLLIRRKQIDLEYKLDVVDSAPDY